MKATNITGKELEQLKQKLKDFREWEKNKEIIYMLECGKKDRKLTVTLNNTYKVYKDEKVILETESDFQALLKYNSL